MSSCASTRVLCNVLLCSCAGACVDEFVRISLRFCAVRAHKGIFVRCAPTKVLCDVRVQMSSCARACVFCAIRAHKDFVPCARAGELVCSSR